MSHPFTVKFYHRLRLLVLFLVTTLLTMIIGIRIFGLEAWEYYSFTRADILVGVVV